MKRHLTFSSTDGKYVIFENDTELFAINAKDMRFDSLKFYNGVYKSRSSAAVLDCADNLDSRSKYVYDWLSRIVRYICDNCGTVDLNDSTIQNDSSYSRIIKLFDLPACAGNGNYSDSDSSQEFETNNPQADFAVKISGESMEPNIPNQSIVLVKRVNGEECIDGEVYIIEYRGDVMCKRFKKLSRGANFVSDNTKSSYIKINSNQIPECRIQGRVIEIL